MYACIYIDLVNLFCFWFSSLSLLSICYRSPHFLASYRPSAYRGLTVSIYRFEVGVPFVTNTFKNVSLFALNKIHNIFVNVCLYMYI